MMRPIDRSLITAFVLFVTLFVLYVDSSVTKQNDVARSIKVHLNQPTHDSGEPIALKWLRMRKKRSTADSISSQADSYTNVNSQSLPAEPLPTPAESKKLVKAGKKVLGLTLGLFIILVIVLPIVAICGLVALCCFCCQ